MRLRHLALALLASFCAPTLRAQTAQPASVSVPTIQIQPGDLLRVRMWPDQAYSGDYPVEATGQVYLPLLGEVQAANRTLDAVRSDLQSRYRALVQNSTVSATVVFRVSVLGAVIRPGLYQVDPSTTVLDAVSLAGGFRDDADGAHLRILRGTRAIDLNATLALEGDQTSLAQQMRSGDRIIVSTRVAPRLTFQGVVSLVTTVATLAVLVLQLRK